MAVRCGVCHGLRSRDGTWTPSFQNVLTLVRWAPVLDGALNICVEGLISDEEVPKEPVRMRVMLRLSERRVGATSSLVHLEGPPFHLPDTPIDVVELFENGFPENWQEAGVQWSKMVLVGGSSESGSVDSSLTSVDVPPAFPVCATPAPTASDSASANLFSDSANGRLSAAPPPWLPAQKVLEITRWMDNAEGAVGRQLGDSSRAASTAPNNPHTFIAPCAPAPQTMKAPRTMQTPRNIQAPVPTFYQSTPIPGVQPSKLQLNMSMSSVSTMTVSTTLGLVDPAKNSRKRPREQPSAPVSLAASSASIASAAPAVTMPPMPKRRVDVTKELRDTINERAVRKVERWRPVLGVDGKLKLQGYLVLNGDCAVQQILTSNTVQEWLGDRVVTVDACQFELIGEPLDPTDRLPLGLRAALGGPLPCEDIENALREQQLLKNDVTQSWHLAPPPAPETIRTTRSGRLCRPRTPYWLNRSDWGAEYEIFYGDSSLSSTSRQSRASSARLHREGMAKSTTPSRRSSQILKETTFPNHMEEMGEKQQNERKSVVESLSSRSDASITADDCPISNISTPRLLTSNLNKCSSAGKTKQSALSVRKLSSFLGEELGVQELSDNKKHIPVFLNSSGYHTSQSYYAPNDHHLQMIKKKLVPNSPRVVLTPLILHNRKKPIKKCIKAANSLQLQKNVSESSHKKRDEKRVSSPVKHGEGGAEIAPDRESNSLISDHSDVSIFTIEDLELQNREVSSVKGKSKLISEAERLSTEANGKFKKWYHDSIDSSDNTIKNNRGMAQKNNKLKDKVITENVASKGDSDKGNISKILSSSSINLKFNMRQKENLNSKLLKDQRVKKDQRSDSVEVSAKRVLKKKGLGKQIVLSESEAEGSNFGDGKHISPIIFKEKKRKLSSEGSKNQNVKSVGRKAKQFAKKRIEAFSEKEGKLIDNTIRESTDTSVESAFVRVRNLRNFRHKLNGGNNVNTGSNKSSDTSVGSASLKVKHLRNFREKCNRRKNRKVSASQVLKSNTSRRIVNIDSDLWEVKQRSPIMFRKNVMQDMSKNKLSSKSLNQNEKRSLRHEDKQSTTVIRKKLEDHAANQVKSFESTISESEENKSEHSTPVKVKCLNKNKVKSSRSVLSERNAGQQFVFASEERNDCDSVESLESDFNASWYVKGRHIRTNKKTKPVPAKNTKGKMNRRMLAAGDDLEAGEPKEVSTRNFNVKKPEDKESKVKQSKAKESKVKHSKAEQSKVKGSKSEQSKAKKGDSRQSLHFPEAASCALVRTGAPKTLRERRARDAVFSAVSHQLGEKLGNNDDPLEAVLQQKYTQIPSAWCDFNNILKERSKSHHSSYVSPASSPSAHSIMSEAPSIVSCALTPQLISKPPVKKHIQSYLQRRGPVLYMDHAFNSQKSLMREKPISIEEMQYGRVFLQDEENEEDSRDEEWDDET